MMLVVRRAEECKMCVMDRVRGEWARRSFGTGGVERIGSSEMITRF